MQNNNFLKKLGLYKQPDYTSMFVVFGAGALLGTGLGFLLAPKSGYALRHDMKEKAQDLVSTVRAKLRANATAVLPSA